MDSRRQTFSRNRRLRKTPQYQRVYRNGRSFRAGPIVGYFLPNGLAVSRLGMAVGRKVGNSPRRNRIKRLFREGFRLDSQELGPGLDVVLIPADRKGSYDLQVVRRSLSKLFRLARNCDKGEGDAVT